MSFCLSRMTLTAMGQEEILSFQNLDFRPNTHNVKNYALSNSKTNDLTIVSGIAERFNPEEVIGKQVAVLVNLAPRALRGVESQGMILMTEDASGKLVFVNPDTDGVGNGNLIS